MSIEDFVLGIYAGLWIVAVVAIPYAILFLIWGLAQIDLFWTVVRERQAKIVLKNEAFYWCFMSFAGHIFVRDIPDFPNELPKGYKRKDPWDIVEDKWGVLAERSKQFRVFHFLTLSLFRNIRWMGLPPVHKIYRYRFTWTSLEQTEDKETGETEMRPVTTDLTLNYVLLQQDVYALLIKTVETKELLPVDIIAILPATVINPVKALFNVQHWLEASENRIGDELRLLVGRNTFLELVQRTKAKQERSRRITDDELGGILKTLLADYGVEYPYLGIRRVDPGSTEAKEFVKATGAVFVAERRARANKLEGGGLAGRARIYYGAVAAVQGGREMLTAEAIRDSKLTVLATGGTGLMPAITVADTTERPPGGESPQDEDGRS